MQVTDVEQEADVSPRDAARRASMARANAARVAGVNNGRVMVQIRRCFIAHDF
jgi:hypothetical protein